MATTDENTDTQTTTAPGAVSPDMLTQAMALAKQFMPQPVQQDTTPVSRSWTSLLGEALGGGPPVAGMTDTDRELAGHQALMQFGTGLMAASRYQPGQTIFSNLAGGLQGAQRGEIGAEEMAMSRLGAQQEYAQQQAQNKLEALKTALPLLTLQTQMQQAAAARNLAGGGGAPPAPNVAQGGSIADPLAGLPKDQALAGVVQRESGGRNVNTEILDPQTGKPASTASGYYQMLDSTWKEAAALAGIKNPPARAIDASKADQDAAASALYDKRGLQDWARSAPAKPPPAAPAPYKVASTGAIPPPPSSGPTAPATGTSAADDTFFPTPNVSTSPTLRGPGSPVPPAPTPTATVTAASTEPAPTTPTVLPNPDIVQGDVVTRHPGTFKDFAAREMEPTPNTADFNPNLSPEAQAAFAARRAGLDAMRANLVNQPFAQQPAEVSKLQEATASLNADMQNAAAAKAETAAAAKTKFDDAQRAAVQTRYDAAVSAYTDAAKGKAGFNQDIVKSQATDQISRNKSMLEPYETSATQAATLLPSIALARQILPELPQNAAPWLADEANRSKLEALAPFLPTNWTKATDGASLYTQIMGNIVGQMAGNVQSGATGGREAAYQQFKTEYPGLANTAEGRERGLLYTQELLQRRMQVAEGLQNYAANAPRDPVTGIPNMAAARSTVENAVPMLQLPPSSYNPSLPPTNPKEAANAAAYARYYNNIPVNGRYIGYERDERGAMHPIAKTKTNMGAPP